MIRFASLQSDVARRLLKSDESLQLSSIVLLEEGRRFTQSAAVLRVSRYLRWPWNFFYGFIIIPKPIRDAFYDFVARNRYRWFGKVSCRIPTPDIASRFL